MMRWSTFWNVLKLALALAFAAIVVSRTNVPDTVAVWHRISLPWLLVNILTFYGIVWSMARRAWIALGKQLTFRQFLHLTVLQTVVGNLVATSAGMLTYVAILRNKYRVQLTQSVASIVVTRLGDLLALLLALAVSSWVLWSHLVPLRWLIIVLLVTITGVVLAFGLAVMLRLRFVRLLDQTLHVAWLDRLGFVRQAIHILTTLAHQDVRQLRVLAKPLAGYSGLILGCSFAFAYSNARLFAVPVGAWPILFILALTLLMAIIPVQVFGGLGVYDVTAIYLYGLFGISHASIAPVIIGTRILFYAINLLLLLYWAVDGRLRPAGGSSVTA